MPAVHACGHGRVLVPGWRQRPEGHRNSRDSVRTICTFDGCSLVQPSHGLVPCVRMLDLMRVMCTLSAVLWSQVIRLLRSLPVHYRPYIGPCGARSPKITMWVMFVSTFLA